MIMAGVMNQKGKRSMVPTEVIQMNYDKTASFDPSTYSGTQDEITRKQKADVSALRKISIKDQR
jgi:hypothetical protein